MSRSIYLYQFESTIAKENYYPYLLANKKSFEAHISERNTLFKKHNQEYDIVNFEQIIEKVRNDINDLTPPEMWAIHIWDKTNSFNRDWKAAYIVNDNFTSQFGIERVLELHRNDSYSFMYQLYEYEEAFSLIKTNIGYGDASCVIASQDFIPFLNYIILLTGQLAELNLAEITDFENDGVRRTFGELQKLKELKKDDLALNKLVEQEINFVKEDWAKDLEKDTRYSNLVWIVGHIFPQALKIKKSLTKSNSNIIICDSI